MTEREKHAAPCKYPSLEAAPPAPPSVNHELLKALKELMPIVNNDLVKLEMGVMPRNTPGIEGLRYRIKLAEQAIARAEEK